MSKDKRLIGIKKYKDKKDCFESWYFALVDEKKQLMMGFLVGFIKNHQRKESYIRVISNHEEYNKYITYPIEQVKSDEKSIEIEGNYFSDERISLNIVTKDFKIKGELTFHQNVNLESSLLAPGLMGPYKYVPFLESYYEVVTLRCQLLGNLHINEGEVQFNEGTGYIEKEWGRNYPKVWMWAQCNHFKKRDLSMMLGIARLPIFFEYHTAFVIPIYDGNRKIILSNYNGGHLAKVYRYKGYVHLIVIQKNMLLDIKIYGEDEALCVASRNSHMIRDVYECDTAKIEIKIVENNELLFEDTGMLCSLEMGGNTSKLK